MTIATGIVLDLKRYFSVNGPTPPPAATWADLSRYKTHGAITTATWQRRPSGLYELDFVAATPDFVEVTCPQLNFTSEDFSIVARINIDSLADARTVFCRGLINVDGYLFVVRATGGIRLYTSQTPTGQYSESAIAGGEAIEVGNSYTVGFSRTGDSVRVFKNGEDKTAVEGTHINPDSANRTAKIGVRNDLASWPYDGQISFLRVYKRALSAGEHLVMHNKLVSK